MPSTPGSAPPASSDPAAARTAMVDELRRAGVVRDGPVEAALRAVERHRFLPAVPVARAYADEAVVTQTAPDGLPTSSASQPSIVAIMLRQLAVQPGHRVLEIGAGTGYNAALLAHLAGHSGQVTTIDVDPVTASAAGRHLAAAGVEGVEVVTADGWLGHPAGAPYDRIEATVGSWDVSTSWVDQLAEGGVLVVPLWLGPGVQASAAFTRNGRELHSAGVVPCGFIRLRGAGAGPETYRRVAGRLVSAERLGAEESSVLERLLATEPSSAPSPPAAPGWLVRLALAGHRAVLLVDEPGRRVAAGLFDPAAGSLVLAEGIGGRLGTWSPETVRCYGGDALLPPLLALLADPEPLEVEQLRVLGVRRGDLLPAAPGSGRTWLLERPEHRFLVRG